MILSFLVLLLKAFLTFLIGTIIFDIFHFLFHASMRSKYKLLQRIGALHMAHHQFFSRSLKINPAFAKKNFQMHLTVEYLISVSGMLLCLLFMPAKAVILALSLQTIIFLTVCYQRGVDPHHRSFDLLPPSRGGFFVNAGYHALHHVYPRNFYGSYCKLVDYILGTGSNLRDKRIAMTGASGALGSAMKKLLEKSGAQIITFKFGEDYTYSNYEKLKNPLAYTDILLLCHGSKFDYADEANCDSFVTMIEMFKQVRKRTLVPAEVWAVGSEIEFHPCFGIKKLFPYARSKRNFAKHARVYFHDKDIQYRHLVHSAFSSRMGPGLMTAMFAARVSLFFIKRDFKYIAVSYLGFGYLNYFRYAFKR